MAASLFQAVINALSKTALISDDIPVAAANLIEVQVKSSHPAADPALLPSTRKGKHMSESEFYLKAAGVSLVPKTAIGLALGAAAGGLSFVGLTGLLTVGLIPLALWICGKSAEKEEGDDSTPGEYKPSWADRMIKMTPGVGKFLDRLPSGHRRILGQTIEMDVALEMEMMTLAAVALGASGLATAGVIGFCATVAIVPVVALAATTIVWSTAFGVRKLRHLIGRNQKDIDAGSRQETRFDRLLKFIDAKIEPTLGLVGKLALMAIGGALIVDQGLIPLAQTAVPHLSASFVPAMHSAIDAFKGLPGIAQLAICAPLGYGIGKFIYNPLITPAMSAVGRVAGKVFGRRKEKETAQANPAPSPEPAPASKIGMLVRLRASFRKGDKKTISPIQSTKVPQAAPKKTI